MVGQSKSTFSTDVAQLELLPTIKRSMQPVDVDYLLRLPTFRRAIRYSVSLADLEPKQIYEPLEMDKAIWSRIENGSMSFPSDDLGKLAQITGNNAPVLWLINQAGYDITQLRALRDDKERRIAELELALAQERAEKETIARFVRETLR